MQTILTFVQVFLSIALIALVLIQHGRGADAGAAFGSGASATVFGARGSGSFLSRATGILAALFFLTSMALAYYAAQGSKPAGLMDAADGMQVKLQVPAKEIPAPVPASVTQTQGSADVPVVPGVVTQSVTSDVPAVPGATPVPAEAKPASLQIEAAPAPALAPKQVQIEAPAAETIKVEVAQPVIPAPKQEEKAPISATELPSEGSAMAPKQEPIAVPAAEPVKVEMPQPSVPTSQQEVENIPVAEVSSQGPAPLAKPAKFEVTQPTVPNPKKEEPAPAAAVPPQGSGAADVPKPESFSVDPSK